MSGTRWHVYLLECDGRAIYTGITTDVARRIAEHDAGKSRAARFTRGCKQLRLLYAVAVGDHALAARVEARLRRLPREVKIDIAASSPDARSLLVRLGLVDPP